VAGLRETQELFWKLITAPEGVGPGLRQLSLSEDDLAQLIRSDERLTATERLDIYANMYFFRLLDVLKDDFPRLAMLLGETSFHNLITSYLLAFPSTHPSLRNAGENLPAFIATQQDLLDSWPWLADLAALEWARHDVFDAEDTPVEQMETLQGFPPEAWDGLRLDWSQGLRVLELNWPVHEAWKALKNDESVPALQPEATVLRVWRQDESFIRHAPMSPLEHKALEAFRTGAALGPICVELAVDGAFEEAAASIAELLQTWLQDQLIASAWIETP
jgi:hypothetical protein